MKTNDQTTWPDGTLKTSCTAFNWQFTSHDEQSVAAQDHTFRTHHYRLWCAARKAAPRTPDWPEWRERRVATKARKAERQTSKKTAEARAKEVTAFKPNPQRQKATKGAEKILRDNTNRHFCSPITTRKQEQEARDKKARLVGKSNSARSQ